MSVLMNRRCLAALLALGVSAAQAGLQAQAGGAQGPPQVLTLERALEYAVEHYPAIRVALEQVTASTAHVNLARSAYLPRLESLWQTHRATANNIFGQLLPQSVIPAMSGPALESASSQSVWGSAAGAFFSWEPVDLGLREASVHEAEAGVIRARAEQALTRLDVQAAVGEAFLGVVSARQAVAAAAADLERREVLARATRVLADSQLRPGADASRADAERAAAQTRAIRARQALLVAQATLNRVLGVTTRPVSVDAARLLDDAPPTLPQSGSASGHPLARTRQAAVELARAREAVLAKTNRPRLYLQSSVFARGSGANPVGPFEGGSNGLGLERANWAAGVQVVFPNVFDFASMRARRAASAASTRLEHARLDEALLSVTTQQETAAALVDAARAVVRNTPVQLAAARESEAQARARFDAGLTSIVDVAETQSLLAQAEYQDAVARVDVWRALLAQAVAQGSLASFVETVRAAGAQ